MTTIFNAAGSNRPNPFSTILTSLSAPDTSASALDSISGQVIKTVTNSPDPATALWQLWDAFFIPIATSPSTHVPSLALLSALRARDPTLPTNVEPNSDAALSLRSHIDDSEGKLHWSALPRFGWQWRDFHDILEANRQWHDREGYFATFVQFLATFLEETKGKNEVHPINVFYACSNILERKGPEEEKVGEEDEAKFSPGELWKMDVRVAATWVKHGGWALWEADQGELRGHCPAALDWETELWPRKDGLTRERWVLWAARLRGLGVEGVFDEELTTLVNEAAAVVEGLLGETPTAPTW
ncbi:hypothetical protein B0T25DRAFT_636024 [Lasiosphaeria hispida]|uniref:Uncharacterized protein n=1 Tax=Lasiosphaeria hispida TaxID=260671 RepID=A0AAJ0H7K3_9PEZI|nr:hypothetical protein B0T25DRAFT_636024 [Lasiosphaeria hispida]